MDLDLQVDGPWKKPNLKGTIQLPMPEHSFRGWGSGSRISPPVVSSSNEQIRIESFQAQFRSGRIEGNGATMVEKLGNRAL